MEVPPTILYVRSGHPTIGRRHLGHAMTEAEFGSLACPICGHVAMTALDFGAHYIRATLDEVRAMAVNTPEGSAIDTVSLAENITASETGIPLP